MNGSLFQAHIDADAVKAAAEAKAWPFEEARKIIRRHDKKGFPETVLFETGYGPSGLPHIGTFGEVARTTMVRHAFHVLTQNSVKTRLLCFSDDMDGMRKVPENVPKQAMLHENLHRPLTVVPSPFGPEYPSFGHHNNAMLRRFLDTFGFDYEFASATDYYRAGRFDAVLLRAAERYQAIMDVMLPTLGEVRQETYSPFLPISPISGRVLYVPMKEVDAKNGTITFTGEDGRDCTLPVTGGQVKLQWKPDFGMRWAALDVDFEMFGKDHMANAVIYDRICEILGGRAPEHFVYELFLDDEGQKISKSKGNGLTIDDWLACAPTESLALFMYQKPKTAKKLYDEVIPRAVDEYFQFDAAYGRQEWAQRLENPVWHIHSGEPPMAGTPVPFSMLINLAGASNAESAEVLWGFLKRYGGGLSPQTHPGLDKLAANAVAYHAAYLRPKKRYKQPDSVELAVLSGLDAALAALPADADGETIQNACLAVARTEARYLDASKTGPDGGPAVSSAFFQMLYMVLLAAERGPRFGSFAQLYGIENTRKLIARGMSGALFATNPEAAAA
ncbi:MAG: lysine--tRNA ligase [Phyllobacteriaceae bacterium]|nr:lysine--tRNA ligase [Phyllobacteriaceae bacterium]